LFRRPLLICEEADDCDYSAGLAVGSKTPVGPSSSSSSSASSKLHSGNGTSLHRRETLAVPPIPHALAPPPPQQSSPHQVHLSSVTPGSSAGASTFFCCCRFPFSSASRGFAPGMRRQGADQTTPQRTAGPKPRNCVVGPEVNSSPENKKFGKTDKKVNEQQRRKAAGRPTGSTPNPAGPDVGSDKV
jgi:hypothetical protein